MLQKCVGLSVGPHSTLQHCLRIVSRYNPCAVIIRQVELKVEAGLSSICNSLHVWVDILA